MSSGRYPQELICVRAWSTMLLAARLGRRATRNLAGPARAKVNEHRAILIESAEEK